MALRPYEMFLFIRAQNQASGVLRRVSADVSGMGRASTSLSRSMRTVDQQQMRMMRSGYALQGQMKENERLRGRELSNYNKLVRARDQYISNARAARASALAEGGPGSIAASARVSEDRLAKMNQRISDSRAKMSQLGRASVITSMQMAELNHSMETLGFDRMALQEEAAAQKTARLHSAFHAIGGAARLLQYAGGGATIALGLMANSAAHLDTQISLAASQTNNMQQTAARAWPAIISIMAKTGTQADDLSASLYDIYSSVNVTSKQGIRDLRLFAQAAVAGQTDVASSTSAFLTIMNNFPKAGAHLKRTADQVFSAVRYGRLTFEEMAKSMSTTVPAANQWNQSLGTMLGTMAFLTRRMGGDVPKAATSFARALDVLNTQKFVDAMHKAGVAVEDAHHRMLPLPDVIAAIARRFPSVTQGGIQNFLKNMSGLQGTAQARRGLTLLFRDVGGYRHMLGLVARDHGQFQAQTKEVMQSAGVQWSIFLGRVRAVFLALGREVIPVFVQMAKPLGALLNWFNSLDAAQKRSIGRWLAYGAVLTAVGGTLLGLGATLAGAILTLRQAGITMSLLGAGVPWLTAIAIAGVLIYKNWSTVGPIFHDVANALGQLPGPIRAITIALLALAAIRLPVILGTLLGVGRAAGTVGFLGALRGSLLALAPAAGTLASVGLALGAVVVGLEFYGALATSSAGPIARLNQHLKDFATASKDVKKQSLNLTQGFRFMREMRIGKMTATEQIKKYRDELSKATAGSKEYQQISGQLSAAMQRQAHFTQMLADAQREVNSSLHGATRAAHIGFTNIHQARQENDRLQRLANQVPAGGIQGREAQGQAILGAQAKAGLKAYTDELNKQAPKWATAFARFNQMVSKGFDSSTPQARAYLKELVGIQAQYEHLSATGTRSLQGLSQIMGRVLTVQEQQFIAGLSTANQAIAKIFMGISHQLPSMRTLRTIRQEFGRLAPEAAALAAHTGKIPSIKRLRVLTNVPNEALPQILAIIKKTGQIPSSKRIKIIVDHVKAVDDARKKVQHLEQLKIHVPVGASVSKMNIDTSGFDRALNQAKAHLAALDGVVKKHRQATIFLKTHPADAAGFGLTTGQAITGGIVQGTAGLNAQLTAALNSQIDTAMKAARAHIKAGSPSKLFAERLGVPIVQGITAGMLKEAGGPKAAMQSILQSLESDFSNIRDTVTQQMGDLFQSDMIQQKREWGAPLNANDILGDIRVQNQSFLNWRRNLEHLFRRHVRGLSGELRAYLEAQGPQSNDAIAALNRMSPAQLRAFVRQFQERQRLISNATKRQFGMEVEKYRKMGNDIAFGLLTGLRQGTPSLMAYITKMAREIFARLQRTNKSHSPSRLYMREGRNMLEGLMIGMNAQTPQFILAPSVAGGRLGAGVVKGGDTYNVKVYAAPMENPERTLERTFFQMKHRKAH